jgi:putative sigma-54 modulation protein
MDIHLTCRRCELSDELRDYVTKKVERVVRHFDGVHNVAFVLSIERGKCRAEMIVNAVRGQKCIAEGTHEGMFAAVDLAVDKMDRQIKKLKGKLRETHGKTPAEPTPS